MVIFDIIVDDDFSIEKAKDTTEFIYSIKFYKFLIGSLIISQKMSFLGTISKFRLIMHIGLVQLWWVLAVMSFIYFVD